MLPQRRDGVQAEVGQALHLHAGQALVELSSDSCTTIGGASHLMAGFCALANAVRAFGGGRVTFFDMSFGGVRQSARLFLHFWEHALS